MCFIVHSITIISFILQTQRKLASKKSEYERINERLMTEMPQLYDGRIDFFEPCVTAVIQSQVCVCGCVHVSEYVCITSC